MKYAMIGIVLAAVMLVGCAPNTEPLERVSTKVIDEVVRPAVEKALSEAAVRTATGQLAGQMIEPGWRVSGEGKLVQGFEFELEIIAVGVAGQGMGHVQTDQGPNLAGRNEGPDDGG